MSVSAASQLPLTRVDAKSASGQLVKYEAMCRAIDEAHTIDEVKEIRNVSVALEHYARQAQNTEAERKAAEIRLRAERKAGQLLAQTEKNKGAIAGKTGVKARPVLDTTPKLSDLGITKAQSSRWQKLAEIPDDAFEEALGQAETPSTTGMLRSGAPPREIVASDALWLWGRLMDFERDGLLAKSVTEVTRTLTSAMKDDVHRLAPQVARWLKQIGGPHE